MHAHQLIDRHRKAAGMTLRALGQALGRSIPWAQAVCDGRQVPDLGSARRIASLFRLGGAERRALLEAVARSRLARRERLTEAEAAPLVSAAGGL